MRSIMGVGNHRVCGDNNTTISGELEKETEYDEWADTMPWPWTNLLLLVSGKYGDLAVCDVGPLNELLFPLHNRNPR